MKKRSETGRNTDTILKSIITTSLLLPIFMILRFGTHIALSDPSLYFLEKEKVHLFKDSVLQQQFIATADRLSSLGVIVNKDSFLPPPGQLRIVLRDEKCEKIIGQKKISLYTIMYSRIEKMTFPTIYNSKGKQYCFEAYYELDETKNDDARYIYLWRSQSVQFENAYYTHNGNTGKGYSLLFRPYYREMSPAAAIAKTNQRISQYKADVFKGPVLTITIMGAFLLSFGITIVTVMKSDNHDE